MVKNALLATVAGVCRSSQHGFSKQRCDSITVIKGLGVDGDAHAGERVQHLSRVRADPSQPNLRQVHLIHQELFDELAENGFAVAPGDLGENVTTCGVALLALSRDTLLHIGGEVVLRVTGLRNPCSQIEAFLPGLLQQVAKKTSRGVVRKAGIMSVVVHGGVVRPCDPIRIEAPVGPHIPLEPV
jgi:MOSC domain-containing protein YiiM